VLKLTVKNGQFEGVTVDVEQNLTIGRGQGAGLFLPDPQISRSHSLVERDETNYWVSDNGSHNGTYVNDIRLENRRVLRDGDLIRVGNTSIEASLPETATQTGRTAMHIAEDGDSLTTTVERNARDLAPPTIDALRSSEGILDGFHFTSVEKVRTADDRAIELILANARRFAILFHVSKSLQEANDIDRLLATMMDHVIKVCRAERGEIVLVNPQTEELVPVLSMDRQGKVGDTVNISRTVVKKVLNSRMAVISTDASSDPRLSSSDSIIMYGMRSIMCVPMISQEKVIGIVQVVSEKDFAAFGEDDLYLLTVIASLAAVSIQNARLYERQKEALEDARRAHEDLVKTQAELIHQEKLATVGQLSTGIAHEIKNSLGPVSLVHLLRERHPDDEVLQEYTDLILESHNRILSIISEVRSFTQGEIKTYERKSTSLRPLLESVVNFLKFDRDVKQAGVKLHIHEPITAEVTGDRIKQVIINLIRNAAQSLPDKDGTIDVTLDRDGDDAIIRVVDNGCGIPEDHLAKIWTPFFTTKEKTGMGLGLDISRMIIEEHGGSMECSSTVGSGTIMTIRLPAAD
jgi:two-component system, NtrC family, sensor kinase